MTTATKQKPATSSARSDEIPLASIDPSPFNPRTEFDDADLTRLAASIGRHGLLQPVVVRRVGERYELVAGERRYRAAKRAGRKSIAAVVRDLSDDDALVLGLVENIERIDLSPVEKARGLARLCAPMEAGGAGMTQKQAAALFKHERTWATKLISILSLPDVWQRRVACGELNQCQAESLTPYAQSPAVLAQIDDDYRANPSSWRTLADFRRNVAAFAGAGDKKGNAAPAEIQPTPAIAETDSANSASPKAEASTDDVADFDAAPLRLDSPESAATATEPSQLISLSQMLIAISKIEDARDLARLATAIVDRRAELARKQKPK